MSGLPRFDADIDRIGGIEIWDDPDLADELLARGGTGDPDVHVSVTELLAPRRAYWQRVGPRITIASERRERMESGRWWHGRLLRWLSGEGRFEVRTRRQGIRGRIDLWTDLPVEVKTRAPGDVSGSLADRPEEIEQIGMYCALTDRPVGRIVRISRDPLAPVDVRVEDVRFPHLEHVRSEMVRRAEGLRASLREGASHGPLPRCPWFERGCEFRAAKVCDCTGSEPESPRAITEGCEATGRRTDIEERWSRVLSGRGREDRGRVPARFRTLVYPRRAFFENVSARTPEETHRTGGGGIGVYDRLVEAIESGPLGEVAALAPVADGPEEDAAGFREAPYLVRSSRGWNRVAGTELAGRSPQYVLELGFRCATSGVSEGCLFIGYENAPTDRERLQVLRIRFRSLEAIRELWRQRANDLVHATESGDAGTLPACAGWMVEACPYRAGCGCGGAEDRSHR